MPKQLLDDAKVGTTVEQMRRERVTERVRMEGLGQASRSRDVVESRAGATLEQQGTARLTGGGSAVRYQQHVDGVPVFEAARAAVAATRADTAMVFVPPHLVRAAAIEAIEAGCKLVVATADEMPVRDTIEIRAAATAHGARLVGPNSPGIISPGKAKMGFMPSFCFTRGNMGVISRSGSLSYEGSKRLTLAGIGQTTVIGIGGDPVKGTTAAEALALFEGRIAQIRLASTTSQNVVTYPVVIATPNADMKLLPGMTAEISFQVDRRDAVLKVPNAALRFYPLRDEEGRAWPAQFVVRYQFKGD